VRITSFGTGLGGAQRRAYNEPPCADCGQETDGTYLRHDLSRSHVKNTQTKKKPGHSRRSRNLPGLPTKTFQTPRPLAVANTFSARLIMLAYSLDCFPASAIAYTRARSSVSRSYNYPFVQPFVPSSAGGLSIAGRIGRPHLAYLPGVLLDNPLHLGPIPCRGSVQKNRSHPIGTPTPAEAVECLKSRQRDALIAATRSRHDTRAIEECSMHCVRRISCSLRDV